MRAPQIRPSAKVPASPHGPADREPIGWGFAILPGGRPREVRKAARRAENHPAIAFPAGLAAYGRFANRPKNYRLLTCFRCFALPKSSWPNLILHHVTTGPGLHAK